MEWTMRWERYVLEDIPDGEVYPVSKEVCPQAGDSDLNIELAAKCTELASDQTLLAWVRTALALMATGVIFDAGVRALYDDSSFTGSPWLRIAQLLQHHSPPRVTRAFVIAALTVLFGLAVMVLLTLLSY